ncbi:MAG TPA: phosphopantetheine-binding protein [Bryobacteraceae bacterium]|jgi:acyl carrier protein|nr:phosphopantetheine-binding protein [Bryobacteraceae bacterium]
MDKRTKIVAIIRQIAGKAIDPAPDESLFESGLLDSNSIIDLLAALESEFGISIPDSDARPRKFESIERIEAYLESRP